MAQVITWLIPILVAVITGGFSYLGVSLTVKTSHKQSMLEIRVEQEKQILIIQQQINGIKEDVNRLEVKQDKHNNIIERTYKLEQQVADIEKRIN